MDEKQIKYLVVGDAMIDKYVHLEYCKQSAEDPSASVYSNLGPILQRPGGCLNVAANIKSLHPDAHVDVASILTQAQAEWLYDTHGVYVRPKFSNLLSSALSKKRYFLGNKQIMRVDTPGAYDQHQALITRRRLACIHSAFHEYDCIVVSDYCKGVVDKIFAEDLSKCPLPVFVDTKEPDLSWWKDIPHCYVKINKLENERSLNQDTVNTIVTQGGAGAFYWPKTYVGSRSLNGKNVPNADVTGAGDCYLAGLVVSYIRDKKIITESMEYADLVARSSVRSFGTTVVKLADVEWEKSYDHY